MKIKEYPRVSEFESDDLLLTDGGGAEGSGTRTIKATDAFLSQADMVTNPAWIAHRNIYRGKNLGNVVTDEQLAAIRDGSFKDLYIGDYWIDTENNVTWLIADLNYWWRAISSNPSFIEKKNVTIIPNKGLYLSKIHNTNTNHIGFIDTDLYKTGLDKAKTMIFSFFGEDNVLYHSSFISNAVEDDNIVAGIFTEEQVTLMNQIMVFGSIEKPQLVTNPTLSTYSTSDLFQLSIFKLNPTLAMNPKKNDWWLIDLLRYNIYATVSQHGQIGGNYMTVSNDIRPVFAIG